MKKLILVVLTLVGAQAFAEQGATMTCTGSVITLIEKSPYLGENSKATQSLYVLQLKGMTDESASTAYFLDVVQEGGGKKTGGAGTSFFFGKNSVGGSFTLHIGSWVDETNDIGTRQTSSGNITYKHGPLKGKNEPVTCVLE